MKPVAKNTDFLASFASATVKNLIRICGKPAVPHLRAIPRKIAEIGSLTSPPGAIIASPFS